MVFKIFVTVKNNTEAKMPGPAGLCCTWISVSFVGMKRFRGVQVWSGRRWVIGWHWKLHGYKPLSNSWTGVLEIPVILGN